MATGALIALAAATAVGTGVNAYGARKQAKAQERAAEQAAAEQNAIAGRTAQQQEAEAITATEDTQKSALRRTVLTRNASNISKLGD